MLQPGQCFYVFEPQSGRVNYTVDHPAPSGVTDMWDERGERYVIAPSRQDLSAVFVDVAVADLQRDVLMPKLKALETARAAIVAATEENPASEEDREVFGDLAAEVENIHAAIAPLCARPELPGSFDAVVIAADGAAKATLPLPLGFMARILVDGGDAGEHIGSFELSVSEPGVYEVAIYCWPFLDASFAITAIEV